MMLPEMISLAENAGWVAGEVSPGVWMFAKPGGRQFEITLGSSVRQTLGIEPTKEIFSLYLDGVYTQAGPDLNQALRRAVRG